jgi:hypothetical protein
MNRVRHLQHTLWMRTSGWGWIFWPILRYCEFLLSSFPRFILALLGWILALTMFFWLESVYLNDSSVSTVVSNSFGNAFAFFLGSDPPDADARFLEIFLAFLAATAGLAHLGVFISHLYSIVARK